MDLYESSSIFGAVFLFYIVLAIALWKMSERTDDGPRWYAFVPVLDFVLFMRVAKRPLWWVFLLLVPIANMVVLAMASMSLCRRFGVDKWWGLLSLISPLNLALYLYLAFGTKTTFDQADPRTKAPDAPTPGTPAVPEA